MQKLTRSTGARLTVIAVFVCIAAATARADEWKPSERAAAQLQPAQTFDGFSVRLPAEAVSSKIEGSADGKNKTYAWKLGSLVDRGGVFTVTTRPATAGQSPDQILTEWGAQSLLGRLGDVGKSPVQSGTVGTETFARMYYHGRETAGMKSILHGFVYAGVAQNRVFLIEARDDSDRFAATLPRMEAAALTFKPAVSDAAKLAETGKELSSDAHLADLADETQVEGYAMRPPKGYMKANMPMADLGTPITAWQGEPNDYGMRPMFVFRTTPVRGANATAPIEDGLDSAVEMLRRFLPSVQVDNTQYGTVHGLDCAYASYAAAQNGQNYHGVIYSIHDGDKVLIAGGVDTAPGSDKSIPILEAACRSIHKP